MLTLLARHSLIDLEVEATGDLQTGSHHTVEDTGITIGQAVAQALGDRAGIERYGWAVVPMDECLVQAAIDLSGRPYTALDVPLPDVVIGGFEAEALGEFMRGFATHAGLTLHVRLLVPGNAHHAIEGSVKALARALAAAVAQPARRRHPLHQGVAVTLLAVLDYEVSNLRSAVKALELVGAQVRVTGDPADVPGADAVVLPGVGHFGEAMRRIRARGLDLAVLRAADEGVRILGFCVGLQLLFSESEESPGVPGIGVLPGPVRRLRTDRKLPHIGWSTVEWAPVERAGAGDRTARRLDVLLRPQLRARAAGQSLVLGRARHGVEFCAAAGRPGVTGLQFQPEKSSAAGLGLLGRWLAGVRAASAPPKERL